jgi:hypothetical protein
MAFCLNPQKNHYASWQTIKDGFFHNIFFILNNLILCSVDMSLCYGSSFDLPFCLALLLLDKILLSYWLESSCTIVLPFLLGSTHVWDVMLCFGDLWFLVEEQWCKESVFEQHHI